MMHGTDPFVQYLTCNCSVAIHQLYSRLQQVEHSVCVYYTADIHGMHEEISLQYGFRKDFQYSLVEVPK
jgi:hypothetical protein